MISVNRKVRRQGLHGVLRCIGQSDDGKYVMCRYLGAMVQVMSVKEWLALQPVTA